MKQFWLAFGLLTGSLLSSTSVWATPGGEVTQSATPRAQLDASGELLRQMSSAIQSLNYELAYINISKLGIESLRYRHALVNKVSLAQLLQMDGPRREVLLRGNEVSYFEPGLEPFTLNGDHIVDSLPAIVFADIGKLKTYYSFISVGEARVADRPTEVIRVVSRDGMRYSYVVWIDGTSRLPLRIDLLDRDGETLEQFRVISFALGDDVHNSMTTLQQASLPPLLTLPQTEKVVFNWQINWLPQGFKEVSRSRRTLPTLSVPVESRLFSDGLFNFSVNVSPSSATANDQYLRQGRKTIHTETRNNTDITIVGELPPSTAKRIAESISLGGGRS